MQNGAFKNCDTLFQPERAAGEPNYETAVLPNERYLRSKTLKGLGKKVAVRE